MRFQSLLLLAYLCAKLYPFYAYFSYFIGFGCCWFAFAT